MTMLDEFHTKLLIYTGVVLAVVGWLVIGIYSPPIGIAMFGGLHVVGVCLSYRSRDAGLTMLHLVFAAGSAVAAVGLWVNA